MSLFTLTPRLCRNTLKADGYSAIITANNIVTFIKLKYLRVRVYNIFETNIIKEKMDHRSNNVFDQDSVN